MPSTHTFTVEETDAGTRLDRWLASQVPELSRSRLKGLIDLRASADLRRLLFDEGCGILDAAHLLRGSGSGW